jgi:hypothetical protein
MRPHAASSSCAQLTRSTFIPARSSFAIHAASASAAEGAVTMMEMWRSSGRGPRVSRVC